MCRRNNQTPKRMSNATTMHHCDTIADTRARIRRWRQAGERIAVVPTMGSLHAGHLALVARARAAADRVVVTIFVNPAQFDDAADLAAYPRDAVGDIAQLQAAGVDLLFMPQAAEIYAEGDETIVEVTELSNRLHGSVRPGHFRGVTTVVARLFNIVQADIACFGEKDYQQLQVIRRMTRDLAFPVEILAVPTVRDQDGLALSSRNSRLTPDDRRAAVVLSQALAAAEQHLAAPGATVHSLRELITAMIAGEPRATLSGLDIVRAETLAELDDPLEGRIAIMLSVSFGEVLLLDQREIDCLPVSSA